MRLTKDMEESWSALFKSFVCNLSRHKCHNHRSTYIFSLFLLRLLDMISIMMDVPFSSMAIVIRGLVCSGKRAFNTTLGMPDPPHQVKVRIPCCQAPTPHHQSAGWQGGLISPQKLGTLGISVLCLHDFSMTQK